MIARFWEFSSSHVAFPSSTLNLHPSTPLTVMRHIPRPVSLHTCNYRLGRKVAWRPKNKTALRLLFPVSCCHLAQFWNPTATTNAANNECHGLITFFLKYTRRLTWTIKKHFLGIRNRWHRECQIKGYTGRHIKICRKTENRKYDGTSESHCIYYYYYYVCVSCHRAFLPGTSLEPAVIPTAQASSFTLQNFPYYVWCSKYSCLL
jgi:hypothetical protein